MTNPNLPPIELLHKFFRYDGETGAIFWRTRTADTFRMSPIFSQEIVCRRWNSTRSGNRADSISGNGYRQVNVSWDGKKKCLIAHRIVWALTYGVWPIDQIDHINGIRSDNRLSNLRAVTASQNQQNLGKMSNNTSGICGVNWKKDCKKWRAEIQVNGKYFYLGMFPTIEEAAAARAAASREHGFTERHGT
jgi:hypothetical protein